MNAKIQTCKHLNLSEMKDSLEVRGKFEIEFENTAYCYRNM